MPNTLCTVVFAVLLTLGVEGVLYASLQYHAKQQERAKERAERDAARDKALREPMCTSELGKHVKPCDCTKDERSMHKLVQEVISANPKLKLDDKDRGSVRLSDYMKYVDYLLNIVKDNDMQCSDIEYMWVRRFRSGYARCVFYYGHPEKATIVGVISRRTDMWKLDNIDDIVKGKKKPVVDITGDVCKAIGWDGFPHT